MRGQGGSSHPGGGWWGGWPLRVRAHSLPAWTQLEQLQFDLLGRTSICSRTSSGTVRVQYQGPTPDGVDELVCGLGDGD